jgi:hypothetical protein
MWLGTVRQPLTLMEESVLLVYPQLLADGRWPNLDFEHVYGPGSLWTLTGVYAVTGPTVAAMRTVGVVYQLIAAVSVGGIMRPWGRAIAGAAAVACWLLLVPITSAFPSVGAAALALLALWLGLEVHRAADRRPLLPFAASFAAGLAISYRPDFVVAALAPSLVLLSDPAIRRTWRRGAAALAAGLLPLAVHVAVVGPRVAARGMVLDPIVRHGPGRRLPLPGFTGTASDYSTRIGELTGSPTYGPISLSAQIAVLFWCAAAAVAVLVAGAVIRWRRTGRLPRTQVAVALFAVGIAPYAMQRPDAAHAGLLFACVVPLLPIGVVSLRTAPDGQDATGARAWAWGPLAGAAVVLVLGAPAVWGKTIVDRYGDALNRPAVTTVNGQDGRSLAMGPGMASDVQAAVAVLQEQARPGESVIVAPHDLRKTNYNETYLYYLLSDLAEGTYHLEMNPGTANGPSSHLPGDLRRADWLILSSRWDGWTEANESGEPGEDAAATVAATEFEPVATAGPYTVLRRSD